VISFSIFHKPEVLDQPEGTYVWWGCGLYPEREGTFVKKRMDQCTGAEILEGTLRNLRFDDQLDTIMKLSICIPCNLPYVNNIWLPRSRGDRPPVVPQGSTNLGLIGEYVELEKDIAFTFEYSTRSAWEAIHQLLRRGPASRRRPQHVQSAALLFGRH
jgi:oleate hydratase